ncbi:putative protein-disulfide isomerase [Tepidimonas ignava]|uniref:DSBA-like thioredoxin domain protein n=1 Tax=Tepidimonas ignava TaxID=114249 RepID=A0A4R3LG99_9BURK|nr:DsbA family protein [Tepidimonas ignava]TCS99089.1 putative protein-disulfide isomerase [Tepidimonas ignava]TSE22828.1 DSBA-like thioredoxin domain protein [Tepidimonas ignava]
MADAVLHYIHDPLCGWCYAASPLVAAARQMPAMEIRLHAGGLFVGANRRPVTPELRGYVLPHDRRIAQLTGQPFGEAYTDGLLRDPSAVLDSEPPIAAVLAADQIAGRGLDLLTRLQAAHYVEGRKLAEREVLVALAKDIGLDETAFEQALDETLGARTQAHLADTRTWMAQVGARGFPTFVLERGGRLSTIEAGEYLGRPGPWQARLRALAGHRDPAT